MSLPSLDPDDPAVALAGEIAGRANGEDPQLALDPRLLADVAALRRMVGERTDDPALGRVWAIALDYLEASVRWARARFLPEAEAEPELRAAIELFRPVHRINPGYVPWPLRSLYEGVADIANGTIVERAETMTEQAAALLSAAMRDRDPEKLEACLTAARGAVAGTPDGHPKRGQRLANLCNVLLSRRQLIGDRQATEEAVSVARAAVAVAGPDSPFHGDAQCALGMALKALATDTGDREIEEKMIESLTAAANKLPAGHPNLVECLSALGTELGHKAVIEGDVAALGEAVGYLARAVAATGQTDSNHVELLAQQGVFLGLLHDLSADRRHAAEALDVLRRAATLAGGHPERAHYLYLLTAASRSWYEATREPTAAEDAIALCRGALAEVKTPAERAPILVELGATLTTRHEEGGEPEDRRAALDALREAVAVDPANPVAQSTLGSALLGTFLVTGDPAALNEAIRHARAAVAASRLDDPFRTRRQNLVGRLLWHRGERTGDQEALTEAITVLNDAAVTARPGDPALLAVHTNLGAALGHLHRLTRSLPALEQAIEAYRWVTDRVPDGHPKRGLYLGNLGSAYLQRYEAAGDRRDLDEGIAATRTATEMASPRDLPLQLINLAEALRERHKLTEDAGDLELAVQSASRAVELLPDDHPTRCAALINLGQAQRRARRLDQALDALTKATNIRTAPIDRRVVAAMLAGDVAVRAGWPETALIAFETAVELLPLLSGRELRQTDQAHQLGRYHGLASDAAAAALAVGRPERALELLEAGRAILHARVLEDRTELAALASRAPELARRFAMLREELGAAVDPADLDRRHELAREWAELVETIRTEHGGVGLPRPPRIEELLPAAADGPVVTLNVSKSRCDALLLTTDGVSVVELPSLSFEDLFERSVRFFKALDVVNVAGIDERGKRLAAERVIGQTIEWLGETVTQPVLAALSSAGEPPRRIWWSPTSLLAFLPLHATVLDQTMSSYTPTVGALLRARERGRPDHRQRGLLVALPNTPGHAVLPGAAREAELLTEMFPGMEVLRDERATRSAVLRELPAHGWVHLACHGHNDWGQPARSHLTLWDGTLDVRDVFALETDQAGFAFLNACETAQGAPNLADEALHLGAAFHLAGYVHVIATLWPAHDRASMKLTEGFYRELAGNEGLDETGSATALHAAVRRLREQYPNRPSVWAPYVHFGP